MSEQKKTTQKKTAQKKIDYKPLYEAIGYTFEKPGVLKDSLIHSSALKKKSPNPFERREFLGDRVLGLCLAEALIKNFPQKEEGYLAKQLSFFASKEVMAELASQIQLEKFLTLSKGERTPAGVSPSILGDALEALFAAVYLDGGFEAAQKVFDHVWTKKLEDENSFENLESKSNLQEWAQSEGYDLPTYEVLDIAGPDHSPTFFVEVAVGDFTSFADGPSKKAAEQSAAKKLLEKLQARNGHAA